MKKRVLLTQSKGRLEGLGDVLEAIGYEVVHQPVIQISVIPEAYDKAIELLKCEWMLFTSQTAIHEWLSLGLEIPFDIRFGAVGTKTAKRLRDLGVIVEVVGEPQNADGLADVFIQNHPDAKSVALPKGNLSLSILEDRLSAVGIDTKSLVIYESNRVDARHLKNEAFDVVFFASPSAVEAFQTLGITKESSYVAIGETTAKAIYKSGQDCVIAQAPTVVPILEAIAKAVKN